MPGETQGRFGGPTKPALPRSKRYVPVVGPGLKKVLAVVFGLFALLTVNSVYLVSVTLAGVHTNIGLFQVASGVTAAVLSTNPLVITAATAVVDGTLSAEGSGALRDSGPGAGTLVTSGGRAIRASM